MSYAETLINEALSYGAEDIKITHGRKHKRLWFTRNGERRFFVFPATPSDSRGLQNSLSDLRKIMGVKRAIGKSDRPKRRKRKTKEPLPDFPKITTKANPFEGLPDLWMRPYRERLEARVQLALYRLSFFRGNFRDWKKSHDRP